jgi:predicted DNA-binding protein
MRYSSPMTFYSFRMPDFLVAAIKKEAEESGKNPSILVRDALEKAFLPSQKEAA